MKILEKMFGSEARVKIMRIFLFNSRKVYEKTDVALRTKVSSRSAAREIGLLEKIGIIEKKRATKIIHPPHSKKDGRQKSLKKRYVGYVLNESFSYLVPLQSLLINMSLIKDDYILRKIGTSGKLKLVVLAGIFIQDTHSRVDILVVGDRIRKKKLDATIKMLEAEIGKELRYSVFETKDFKYRVDMYDKLVRDIFEYPHKKILNKLGVA